MSFKDIKGNLKVIEALKVSFSKGKEANSYLFWGQAGIGKKLVAITIAKVVNCLERKYDFDCCDVCRNCIRIEKFIHPDVFCIFPEESGSIKIDQIRYIKERVYLKSYEAKKKFFIIDDAETLTIEAANAFLKILEEPSGDSLFILVSSKPNLLPSTVLSRCQKISFSPLAKDILEEFLRKEFRLERNLSHYLAYFCEGRLGKALRLIKENNDILGMKNKIIDEFVFSDGFYEDKDIKRNLLKENLNILISWFRDLYFIKIGFPYSELINIDRKDDLLKMMKFYSLEEVKDIIDFISDSISYLEKNVNPKLIISGIKTKLWRRYSMSV
ncbi:MAG: DNA polymerase III subunit delta' [Candidatus Omnitrophica bacterium]|nr:DNA polymerase III subunit delta' [Candidatus Omnitrophota bacterium]